MSTLWAQPRLAIGLFDMVATDRIPVIGMHLGFPGLMHLDRYGEGYRLMPMPWRHTL